MRKRPLFLCACFFLTGLVCYRYQRYELYFLILGWCIYELSYFRRYKKKMLLAGRCALLLSAFFLGVLHMTSEMTFREDYMSKIKDGEEITVWGEVIKTEFKEENSTNSIYLSNCFINRKGETIPCNDVIVYSSKDQFQIGEIHKITGELHIFPAARNEGGFDSRTYYQSQKIDFAIYEKERQLLAVEGRCWKEFILSLKKKIGQVYERHASARTAGFLSSMVLGDKSGLEKDLKDLFTDGGLAHILAISGLHVSIIGSGFYGILRKRGTGFRMAGVLSGMVLLAYCFMVGSGMSAVRAVGMMLIFFVAQMLGRSYDMLNSLGVMVLFLLWENPFLLEYSGFWFSVLALIGVGFVGSNWGRFGMGVGITLTTLPLVALCYYEIPLYSPFTNFLLLPILTPIFVLALLGGLAGIWFPGLAGLLLLPCEWGLGFYEWVCQVIEKLPYAIIISGKPNWGILVVYYAILFVGTYFIKTHYLCEERKNRRIIKKINRKGYLIGLGLSLICLVLIIYPKPQPKEITFLDVGQGDGIYISTGEHINYFIDGGSAFSDSLGEYTILPFLKSKGVTKVNYWFVSHADKDHISGLLEVLESGYRVEHLVISRFASEDEKMSEIISIAKDTGTEILYMQAGDALLTPETKMICIYPGETDLESNPEFSKDRNDGSLVLELYFKEFGEIDGFTALFSGDISGEVEEVLLAQGRLPKVWLYKAAHHGSKNSNAMETMQALAPKVAVISCGRNNSYGHPHGETLDRFLETGVKVYRTDEAGAIEIRMDGDRNINIISVGNPPDF